MGKLVILRGNSGSGKSTLARRLQWELGRNTLLIPQDVVRRDMLWARDGADTAALPLLRTLLRYGHENCEASILEGILYADWYRPLFQDAAALYGENIFAYYYDLPFEETLRRHETKPNRADFGEEDMRRWWRERDFIGFIPEKVLGADVTLEAAEERVLRDLQKS